MSCCPRERGAYLGDIVPKKKPKTAFINESQLKAEWEGVDGAKLEKEVGDVVPKKKAPVITGKEVKTPITDGDRELITPKQVQIPQALEKIIKTPLSPMITQTRRESTLLKERIRTIAKGAREGARGQKELDEAITKLQKEEALGKQARKNELARLRQRIIDRQQFIERGKRQGTIATKENIQKIQNELRGIIETNLPKEERGSFLAALERINTPEKFQKELPDILRRIGDILERVELRDIKRQIAKELKEKTTRRNASGVIIGKVTAQAQKELDKIKSVLAMKKEAALDEFDTITSQIGETLNLTDELAERISLLQYAGGEMTSDQAAQLLENIKSIKETGKTLRILQVENQTAEVERIQDAFVDAITGGKGLAPGTGIAPMELPNAEMGFIASLKRLGTTAEDSALMTTFLMDKLARADTASQYMESSLNKWWRQVFEARNIQDKAVDAANADIKKGIVDNFGVEADSKAYRDLLTKILEEKKAIGTFKNAEGESFEIKMTGSQAMYHWGQQQNPAVLPTYKETMQWTDEMISALDKSLSSKEKDFVRFLSEGEDSFFGRFRMGEIDDIALDPIYERQFGTSLGTVKDMYIPLQRDVDLPSHVQLLQDTARQVSTKPSAIKARVKNKTPINLNAGIFETTQSHIIQMAHYKAFSDFVNQGRRVFEDTIVKNTRYEFVVKCIVEKLHQTLWGERVDRIFKVSGTSNTAINKSLLCRHFDSRSHFGFNNLKIEIGFEYIEKIFSVYFHKLNVL